MKEFDFEVAHAELAVPALWAIEDTARRPYELAARDAAELRQDADLSLAWQSTAGLVPASAGRYMKPGTCELYDALSELGDKALAKLARAIYAAGHWQPAPGYRVAMPFPLDDRGTHWKLAMYCDQVLVDRHGIGADGEGIAVMLSNGRSGDGATLKIDHGTIRLHYSHDDGWDNADVGLATGETIAAVRDYLRRYDLSGTGKRSARKSKRPVDDVQSGRVDLEQIVKGARSVAAVVYNAPADAPIWDRPLWDLEPYMVDSGEWARRDARRRQAKLDERHAQNGVALKAAIDAIRALPCKRPEDAIRTLILDLGVSREFLRAAGIDYSGPVLWERETSAKA